MITKEAEANNATKYSINDGFYWNDLKIIEIKVNDNREIAVNGFKKIRCNPNNAPETIEGMKITDVSPDIKVETNKEIDFSYIGIIIMPNDDAKNLLHLVETIFSEQEEAKEELRLMKINLARFFQDENGYIKALKKYKMSLKKYLDVTPTIINNIGFSETSKNFLTSFVFRKSDWEHANNVW